VEQWDTLIAWPHNYSSLCVQEVTLMNFQVSISFIFFYNVCTIVQYENNCKKRENLHSTVKLGDKERFDKEQIGVKEPFPMTNCQFTS
jgi:hypothetical protein